MGNTIPTCEAEKILDWPKCRRPAFYHVRIYHINSEFDSEWLVLCRACAGRCCGGDPRFRAEKVEALT